MIKDFLRDVLIPVYVPVLVVCIVAWVILSYFEAQRFEALTGKNVSMVDAMFLQLQVREPIEDANE